MPVETFTDGELHAMKLGNTTAAPQRVRGKAESNHERGVRRAGRRLFVTWTMKDMKELTAILREHKRFKKMQKELRRRVERYNKKARRERCAHYAPVLRIKP
jgi:hypothetical protein